MAVHNLEGVCSSAFYRNRSHTAICLWLKYHVAVIPLETFRPREAGLLYRQPESARSFYPPPDW